MANRGDGPKANAPLELRMAKVLADPLRVKILAELYTRPMSPKEFFEEFGGGSIPRVARHFEVLVEYGWLWLVETKSGGSRRGAVEHFYRSVQPVLFDTGSWAEMPDSMKAMFTWKAFDTLVQRVREAMEAGTIDAREDRHFTWTPLSLDLQGWERVIAKVDNLFEQLFVEQAEAEERLAETDEEPIPMTVALTAFESPKDTTKAP